MPLLVSHTRDEMRLFAVDGGALGAMPADDAELAARLGSAFPDGAAAAAAYRAAEPDASAAELWLSFLTDQRFHMPDVALADARAQHSADVWMARFAWPSPALDGRLGACHAIEIPFLFSGGGNLGGMTDDDGPPRALADAIQDAWAAFARDGDPATASLPPWPRYEPEHRFVMEFADQCAVDRRPRRCHPPPLARHHTRLKQEGHACAPLFSKRRTPRSWSTTSASRIPGPGTSG